MMYSVKKDVFEVSILDILREKASESELQQEREDAYRKKVIAAFHDDYCTIRRDMISEGILARENAVYVRL